MNLMESVIETIGGMSSVKELLERSGDAVEWALIHSDPDGNDDLEMMARAVTSLIQASLRLTAGDTSQLSGGMAALAAYFVFMIEAEQDIQKTFGRPLP